MSDLFHPDVPFSFVDLIWDTMIQADWHTYQILTKRPDRMQAYMVERKTPVLDNVHLGVSCEDEETWRDRVGYLLNTPAAIRWISCEPLLGLIPSGLISDSLDAIDWIVVGGESGPVNRIRPCDPNWVRRFRDACLDAGVPFTFKQWGNWLPLKISYPHGKRTARVDGAARRIIIDEEHGQIYAYVPQHVSGNMLDGRIHEDYPGKE
jgi:protein gp37